MTGSRLGFGPTVGAAAAVVGGAAAVVVSMTTGFGLFEPPPARAMPTITPMITAATAAAHFVRRDSRRTWTADGPSPKSPAHSSDASRTSDDCAATTAAAGSGSSLPSSAWSFCTTPSARVTAWRFGSRRRRMPRIRSTFSSLTRTSSVSSACSAARAVRQSAGASVAPFVDRPQFLEVGLQLLARLTQDRLELPLAHRLGSALDVLHRIAERVGQRGDAACVGNVRACAERRGRRQHLGDVPPVPLAGAHPLHERLQRGERGRGRRTEELLDLRAGAGGRDDGIEQLPVGALRAGRDQVARVAHERRRDIFPAGHLPVQVDELGVLRPVHPAADLERELRVADARLRGGQDLGDACEPDERVERRQRRGAFSRERAELVPERGQQLTLMEVFLREGIRPRLLVGLGHRVCLRLQPSRVNDQSLRCSASSEKSMIRWNRPRHRTPSLKGTCSLRGESSDATIRSR